jgi:hypothetical protein
MGSRSRPLGTLGVGGESGAPPGSSGRGRLGGLGGPEAGPLTAAAAAPAPAPSSAPGTMPRLTPAERFKPKPQPRSTRRASVEVSKVGWAASRGGRSEARGEPVFG